MDERVIGGVIFHQECRPPPQTRHRFETIIGVRERRQLVDDREYCLIILGLE